MASETYSIRETLTRVKDRIISIVYVYSETQEVMKQAASTEPEKVLKSRGTRTYETTILRSDYEKTIAKLSGKSSFLPFDEFVYILRPLMMGTYRENELRHAFNLLDMDGSGTVDIDEFVRFLPIIDSNINRQTLLRYIDRVDDDENTNIDYFEFKTLILSGVGRDLIMGHI